MYFSRLNIDVNQFLEDSSFHVMKLPDDCHVGNVGELELFVLKKDTHCLFIDVQGPPRYMHQFGEFRNHGQLFPLHVPPQQDKPKLVDAVSIFRRPGRLARPDRIVVILRGLPGKTPE